MKRTGLILTTVLLFILSLYVAYMQGYLYINVVPTEGLINSSENSGHIINGFLAVFASIFLGIFEFFNRIFAGNMLVSIIVLALIVELITLYPAAGIQLKQKKIHLFHKKLIDRFKSGEITMSESKRELDLIYAVNEKLHRRGAGLVVFQLIAFILVLAGLYVISLSNNINMLAIGSFNLSMLSKPVNAYLPILAALAYLLHALFKIHVRQKDDYVSKAQINVALAFSVLLAIMVYFFAANFAILLTIYVMTQITFASMRFLIVEEHSKSWGKLAQKELIKMLHLAKRHTNKVEHASRKFNHLAPVRHINFHLLEEGLSMSLALVIALTYSGII